MSGTSPERTTLSGTLQFVEPRKPFDPDTDQVSAIRSLFPWFNRDYLEWVEEGRRLHAERQQAKVDSLAARATQLAEIQADRTSYLEQMKIAMRVESNVFVRAGVAQPKGDGGKTSLIAAISSVTARYCHRNTLVIENNQAMGNMAPYLGIPEYSGMSVRQAAKLELEGQLENSANYSVRIPTSKYGVMLLSTDKVVHRNDIYGRDVAVSNMQLAQRHFPLIFNDTGNSVQDPATGGVLDSLNVLMFPTTTGVPQLKTSREVRELLYTWATEGNEFAQLVDNSIQVVMGLEPNETLESYRAKLNLSDDRLLFALPYEAALDNRRPSDTDDFRAIDFDVASLDYEIACCEIALAVLRIARNQAMSPTDRARLKSGHMVTIPSRRTPVLPWIDGSEPIAMEQKGE